MRSVSIRKQITTISVVFTSGFSGEKIAYGGLTNYCWGIERTSSNHDVIQAMIMIGAMFLMILKIYLSLMMNMFVIILKEGLEECPS